MPQKRISQVKSNETPALKKRPAENRGMGKTTPVHPVSLMQAIENPRSAAPGMILQLQRLYGNRAVGQMFGANGKRSIYNSSQPGVLLQTANVSSLQTGPYSIQRKILVDKDFLTANEAAALLRRYLNVKPPLALDQIVTRYDFQNKKFVNFDALLEAVQGELGQYAESYKKEDPEHTLPERPANDQLLVMIVESYLEKSILGKAISFRKEKFGVKPVNIVRLSHDSYVRQYHKNEQAGIAKSTAFAGDLKATARAFQMMEKKPVTAYGFMSFDHAVLYVDQGTQKDTHIHESIHWYGVGVTESMGRLLNEGITEFFTQEVCKQNGIEFSTDSYVLETSIAKILAKKYGIELLIEAYFSGETEKLMDQLLHLPKGQEFLEASLKNDKISFQIAYLDSGI